MLKSISGNLFIAFFFSLIVAFFLEFEEIQEVLRVESKYEYTNDIFVYLFGLIVFFATTFIVFSIPLPPVFYSHSHIFVLGSIYCYGFPGVVLTKETNSSIGYFYFFFSYFVFYGVVFASFLLKFKRL